MKPLDLPLDLTKQLKTCEQKHITADKKKAADLLLSIKLQLSRQVTDVRENIQSN